MEKCHFLSSPFSDVLFDPAVMVRVQDTEHLASQQCALSFAVRGLASFQGPPASATHDSKIKCQTRRGAFLSASSSAPVPRPSTTGGSFRARGSHTGGSHEVERQQSKKNHYLGCSSDRSTPPTAYLTLSLILLPSPLLQAWLLCPPTYPPL
ncbi:hypothetical protein E2C01_050703 [Portunus trituberculatus]|uniref:Uncharacterized protein n=1 Tax=Portunus trituberculatus TaxID=210409 RepID=A0A5B7GHP9_PORTR|nr:hypothetical protein [Portunus trituberculatus]